MKDRLLGVAAIFAASNLFMGPRDQLDSHWLSLSAQDLASGQPASPARPKFVVASIKQCQPAEHAPPATSSPGRLGMSCWPLIRLIQDAHDTFAAGKVDPLNPAFPLTPIEGNPAWIDSIRYTIDARTEGPESVAMMRGPIMQTLLEDRFHLKVHRETREVPVYMMAVAEGGPKLRPAKDGSCTPLDPTDLTQSPNPIGGKPWCVVTPPVRRGSTWVWDVGGMSLDVFSKLIHPDGKRVINRTGLTGTFDIHLEWDTNDPNSAPPDSGAASEPVGRSLTVAIRKQLGLQFDRGKGPQEFLIIDHVEKPTEN